MLNQTLHSGTIRTIIPFHLSAGIDAQSLPERMMQVPRAKAVAGFSAGRFYPGDDWGTGENLMKAGISTGPADTTLSATQPCALVNLPHDWAVELPFDSKGRSQSRLSKPWARVIRIPSVGWYRRTFQLSKADSGKRHLAGTGRCVSRLPRIFEQLPHRAAGERVQQFSLRHHRLRQ